jgi:hypothetical protein
MTIVDFGVRFLQSLLESRSPVGEGAKIGS